MEQEPRSRLSRMIRSIFWSRAEPSPVEDSEADFPEYNEAQLQEALEDLRIMKKTNESSGETMETDLSYDALKTMDNCSQNKIECHRDSGIATDITYQVNSHIADVSTQAICKVSDQSTVFHREVNDVSVQRQGRTCDFSASSQDRSETAVDASQKRAKLSKVPVLKSSTRVNLSSPTLNRTNSQSVQKKRDKLNISSRIPLRSRSDSLTCNSISQEHKVDDKEEVGKGEEECNSPCESISPIQVFSDLSDDDFAIKRKPLATKFNMSSSTPDVQTYRIAETKTMSTTTYEDFRQHAACQSIEEDEDVKEIVDKLYLAQVYKKTGCNKDEHTMVTKSELKMTPDSSDALDHSENKNNSDSSGFLSSEEQPKNKQLVTNEQQLTLGSISEKSSKNSEVVPVLPKNEKSNDLGSNLISKNSYNFNFYTDPSSPRTTKRLPFFYGKNTPG